MCDDLLCMCVLWWHINYLYDFLKYYSTVFFTHQMRIDSSLLSEGTQNTASGVVRKRGSFYLVSLLVAFLCYLSRRKMDLWYCALTTVNSTRSQSRISTHCLTSKTCLTSCKGQAISPKSMCNWVTINQRSMKTMCRRLLSTQDMDITSFGDVIWFDQRSNGIYW